MNPLRIIFFGSTTDSIIVLETLAKHHVPVALVTQPPKPLGRKQILTPTPVEQWGKTHGVPVVSFPNDPQKPSDFENEQAVVDTLQTFKADLLVSASYGQKIPANTINDAPFGGLNIHPSVLPRWRGADPVPWAILTGDAQTGVTVVTLSETFDQGQIIAQKKIPIGPHDTSDPLRTKLFQLGAELLNEALPDYLSGKNKGKLQETSKTPYARKLTRQDGFEAWKTIQEATVEGGGAGRIDYKFRALTPWPGVWTLFAGKRLKILGARLAGDRLTIDTVQLEGKNPVPFAQFAKAYLNSP